MTSIIRNIVSSLALLAFLATGCKKEAALTPSEKPENIKSHLKLPQGNHSYDPDILTLFQKYNTLFLYKYDSMDLYYNESYYEGGIYDKVGDKVVRTGYFDVPADENYIGQQLDMIKDLWLKYWPDALLREGMPHKVFLVDSFYKAWEGPGHPSVNWPEMQNFYEGGDFFLVPWGSSRITTIPAADKYAVKAGLNARFLAICQLRGLIKPPATFVAVTNYSSVTWQNAYELGVLDWAKANLQDDWNNYVKMIVSNSYTELISSSGWLHASTDTKGNIRKKYNIVLSYFQSTFGLDLQTIGNTGKP